MTRKKTILCVGGARPNFIKLAPLVAALDADPLFHALLLHTGQHYDARMSQIFFDELGLRSPDFQLSAGSGSHAVQTANIMPGIDDILDENPVDLVLVVGDVNSTLAAALVAKKKHIPVVHVEAGLRSGDETMPEEINRIITDRLSDVLYITEESARSNLFKEGIEDRKIVFAGNVMIDTLVRNMPRAVQAQDVLRANGVPDDIRSQAANGYAVATLHRPANVDDRNTLKTLIGALENISRAMPVIIPAHPRTARLLQDVQPPATASTPIQYIEPVGYLSMLGLMKDAKVVITDSGGIQEETTGMGVPCLTVRPSTERPITVDCGTNTIVGVDADLIVHQFHDILQTGGKAGRMPPLWDGHASERILADLAGRYKS
ncbi:MAG: UDP-N-acetylglucosamine 2-epimerase (non-hydrolyzing) [Hyphomicrobiales bacterium]|nr:UDP-N-acetylglucosamine 2-epimerase (non-hydrolyzing) [Hyphomicrobiales bacterium]